MAVHAPARWRPGACVCVPGRSRPTPGAGSERRRPLPCDEEVQHAGAAGGREQPFELRQVARAQLRHGGVDLVAGGRLGQGEVLPAAAEAGGVGAVEDPLDGRAEGGEEGRRSTVLSYRTWMLRMGAVPIRRSAPGSSTAPGGRRSWVSRCGTARTTVSASRVSPGTATVQPPPAGLMVRALVRVRTRTPRASRRRGPGCRGDGRGGRGPSRGRRRRGRTAVRS